MTVVSRGMGQADVQVCIASDGSCSGTPTPNAQWGIPGSGAGASGGDPGVSILGISPAAGGIGIGSNMGIPSALSNVAWVMLALFGVAVFIAYKVTEG